MFYLAFNDNCSSHEMKWNCQFVMLLKEKVSGDRVALFYVFYVLFYGYTTDGTVSCSFHLCYVIFTVLLMLHVVEQPVLNFIAASQQEYVALLSLTSELPLADPTTAMKYKDE